MSYTRGPGTDQPVSVTRYNYQDHSSEWPVFTLFPYWNRDGQPVAGSFEDGALLRPLQLAPGQTSCGPAHVGTDPTRCVLVQWPAGYSAYDRQRGVGRRLTWNGTLLESKRDGSGLTHRRNRQYDPETGRFTQEDPIGLAGGLNLYGFANGDPVNFSDPFGLKVCFEGSARTVQRFKAATERATDTQITLDKKNCVASFREGSDPRFDEYRRGFADLVADAAVYTVRYTKIFNSEQISKYFIDVFEDYNALAYPARVGGKCLRDQVPWSLSQLVAHELYHHYTVPRTGLMNPSESGAVDAENAVNRKIGRPLRCAY